MQRSEDLSRYTAGYPHPGGAPYPTNFDNIDDELLMQLMLLDQQNKGRPDYVPKVPAGTRQPRRLDNKIGNMFVGGHARLACGLCMRTMFNSDHSLWPDLQRHVHVVLPVYLRIGPDTHQCFCGYFSFIPDDLAQHLQRSVDNEQDTAEMLAGLTRRIEVVNMHKDCRDRLTALLHGQVM